jgi:serine/threonine-protein kinase
MDAEEARPLAGTEGAIAPFFSPDGQWIGFSAGGKLKKVSISGGAPLTLCDATNLRGATWGPDNTIVFSPTNPGTLWRVSAAGGAPQKLTDLKEEETDHRLPHFLPDGKAILFNVATRSFERTDIAILRLDSGEQRVLIQDGLDARYAPTGHLVYYRAGTLMAVPFDPERLEVVGTPTPVVEGVIMAGNARGAQYSFSGLGSFAYVPGRAFARDATLVWVDRKGTAEPLKVPRRQYSQSWLSPDGQQVAVEIDDPKPDIWIHNLERDTLTRLTFEGRNTNPVWTPDGKRVAFASDKAGRANLFWKPADGSGAEERLTTSGNIQIPGSFSPDGRTFLYHEVDPQTGRDVWILPLEGERKPRVFLRTEFNEVAPRFSPDGHWVVYASDESGRNEIYVQPFPGPGGKYQISTDGGTEAIWRANGEIFYRNGDRMMGAEIKTQPNLTVGRPRLLFEGRYLTVGIGATPLYDVTADSQRFLMIRAGEESAVAATQIHVVLNWFEELKKRVPSGQ